MPRQSSLNTEPRFHVSQKMDPYNAAVFKVPRASGDRFFCAKPFEWFEVGGDGSVHLCCPAWLREPVGNLLEQDVATIWNSPKAQAIRRSIQDRSYSFCDQELCPQLNRVRATGLSWRQLIHYEKNRWKYSNTELRQYPHTINCAFDRSCNLSCPSCRNELIALKDGTPEHQRAMILRDRIMEALPHIRKLYVTGSGDPFASKIFYGMLREIDLDRCPQLEVELHTNGQLLETRWPNLSNIHPAIRTLEISIDAADEDVYRVVRRGGTFSKLMESLEYVSELRRTRRLKFWRLSFVVQTQNFHQMADFVRLGKRLGADLVYFSRLVQWGHMGELAFRASTIADPDHPRHEELLQQLSDPIFDDPICSLGNLSALRARRKGATRDNGSSGPIMIQSAS